MRDVEYSGQFRRDVKRVQKRGKDTSKLRTLLALLIQGSELPTRYRDHSLSGPWHGVRDAHIEPDWLLLYSVNDTETRVRFERTGSHADLFE